MKENGADGDRTHDLQSAILALSRLSYGPVRRLYLADPPWAVKGFRLCSVLIFITPHTLPPHPDDRENLMVPEWIFASAPDLAMVVLSAVVIYVGVIVATRISGLRSFAQFSSFDFAISIAIGSLISMSLLSPDPPLLQALTGLAAIYLLQKFVAVLRRSPPIARLVDNTPTFLIRDGELLHDNLRHASVTENDLRSILRRRNIHSLQEVDAVILETAGTISVLHSADGERDIDPWILENVRGLGGEET